MNKYIGTYRIVCERDIATGEPLDKGSNTYIKCKFKGQVYRFNDDVLVLYLPSITRGNRLLKSHLGYILRYDRGDEEFRFYFLEKYLEKFLEQIPAMIKGCNIKPKSKRNINAAGNVKNTEKNAV